MSLVVVTANVNGIRAALRRGGLQWLAGCGADVVCLQEVRATPDEVGAALGAEKDRLLCAIGDWMAERATGVEVHRAATYAERWSDHAAVTATFA
ncbi:MAG: endonuclease/exonuclease/phosphatase family protein [Candidatus Nanopelagicales bacterium]